MADIPLRDRFSEMLKAAMRAHDVLRTSTVRMILARVKDADIAARPKLDRVADDDVLGLLRGMVKQRRESVELYVLGGRPELADKERAEIAIIEEFLPAQLDDASLAAAVDAAVAAAGAATARDMGRVMAELRARHGAALDMARAGALVKTRLSA
jgi:uncharacterized protein YqeY